MNTLLYRVLWGCALVAASAMFSGCIVSKETRVVLLIDTNLTGSIEVEVVGVHSESSDPDKKVREFDEYRNRGYVKEGEALATVFGIENPVIAITNQTATNCNLVVEGTFGNVVRLLSFMASEGDYEIKKADGFLIVRLFMHPPETATSPGVKTNNTFTLVVYYDGEIQDHNAHQFNQEVSAMTWFDARLDESGIQFVLKLPAEIEDGFE